MHVKTLPHTLNLDIDERLAAAAELNEEKSRAERLLQALSWKQCLEPRYPLIVALVGGTGTGKSTLFNSLAGRAVSAVGIRRPCTLTAMVFVHHDWEEQFRNCPFSRRRKEIVGEATSSEVRLETHDNADLAGFLLVDTPDVDSVELGNRLVAEDFFFLSDVMVFVTSQEKYGDLSGQRVREEAKAWGKMTLLVMNKVVSTTAFEDFRKSVAPSERAIADVIRVERLDSMPELIPGLWRHEGFLALRNLGSKEHREEARRDEMVRLVSQTRLRLETLEESLSVQFERINRVNERIGTLLDGVRQELNAELDDVVSVDVEAHIQERLQQLLRKYDIFFVPRMIIRNAVKKALGLVAELLFSSTSESENGEKALRSEDLETTRSSVRLEPLQSAVAKLNLRIAEMLASDPTLEDLRRVARTDVPAFDEAEIRRRFEKAFPGVQSLLEAEFNRLRAGLTLGDEVKLYGSYTVWALLLVTAEIVLGGGFTLLDALLNTAIVPFIPKWLLNLKIVDLLREIGERVDREYRDSLRTILEQQGEVYVTIFRGLVPDEEAVEAVHGLRLGLSGAPG
jgi:energy-coupling factor transporter ATP-binding protein EcfA2